jgi:hypothetical protein
METKDFFSIGISFTALIFSLYFSPIIRQKFRSKKCRQVVANKIQLTHLFGNTYMTIWIDFENSGGKRITISQIKCFIFRDTTLVQTLNGEYRYLTESLSQKETQVPLSDISLNPEDRWSGYISLMDTINYTTSIEGGIRTLLDKTRCDRSNKLIQQEREMAEVPNEKRPLIEISPYLVEETLSIVNSLRKLGTGSYHFLLCVYEESDGNENNQKPFQASGFRFSLFDSDVHQIFENIDKEEYRYGYGIDLPARKGLKQVFVRVHSIDHETTNNLLKRIG